MSEVEAEVTGVIWESCLKFEKCVKLGFPINKKICVGVKACLRLIEKGGAVVLQVDAAGKRFEYKLTNACHTIFTVAVGRIEICIAPRGGNSIRLQAKACIGYGPVNKCWDIWGTDISWLTAEEFAKLDLGPLDLPESSARYARNAGVGLVFEDEYLPVGTCGCSETETEVAAE